MNPNKKGNLKSIANMEEAVLIRIAAWYLHGFRDSSLKKWQVLRLLIKEEEGLINYAHEVVQNMGHNERLDLKPQFFYEQKAKQNKEILEFVQKYIKIASEEDYIKRENLRVIFEQAGFKNTKDFQNLKKVLSEKPFNALEGRKFLKNKQRIHVLKKILLQKKD